MHLLYCMQCSKSLKIHLYRLYTYVSNLETLYIDNKHMFCNPICLFARLFISGYMKMHLLLHINAPPNEESYCLVYSKKKPKIKLQRLIRPCNNTWLIIFTVLFNCILMLVQNYMQKSCF